MFRFALFVDGSNLFGSLKSMGLEVDDYQQFFSFIFEKTVEPWRDSISSGASTPAQLRRIYWYEVGSMDEWDLADAKSQATLREWFDKDKDLKGPFMASAGQKLGFVDQEKVAKEAWAMCFEQIKDWYDKKRQSLEGIRRFHHGVRTKSDWIDIIEAGHWKLDLLHRRVDEKGLDTSLAVDMVTQSDNFDVAVLVSGDADGIPSIRYLKTRNKEVAAVEFVSGYPPDKRGRGFSSKLKLHADFVVRIFEMELIAKSLATKSRSS